MEKNGLPPRQRAVYDFIAEYRQKHGFSPAKADIAGALGLSGSTVAAYVGILCRKGMVRYIPNVPRSLTIAGPEAANNTIP